MESEQYTLLQKRPQLQKKQVTKGYIFDAIFSDVNAAFGKQFTSDNI